MKLKTALRGLLLDWLADRDDRYYWRQPSSSFTPPRDGTFCLWQPDGKLGDSVIHTALIASLQTQRPDLRLMVVCAPSLVAFWERIPGIQTVIGAPSSMHAARAVLATGKRLDVFVSMEAFLSIDTVRFMRAVDPAVRIGLNVGRYRAFTYSLSDQTYDHPRRHVTERMRNVCELMQLGYQDTSALKEVAPSGLTPRVTLQAGVPHVLLNTYGAGRERVFSPDSVRWIVQQLREQYPTAHIIFNAPDAEHAAFAKLHALDNDSALALAPPNMSLWELIALISQCRMVVTPDTGIGHIAAALGIPITVFFADIHYTPVVWLPNTHRRYLVKPTVNGDVNLFDRDCAQQALTDMVADVHPRSITPRPDMVGSL